MGSTGHRFPLTMNAQFVPRRFREVHVVVACSFLDVGERQGSIGIGNVDDLIETSDRITDMLCVGQWFFTLARKCVDAVGQVALRHQPAMFLVRFPSCFRHVSTVFSLTAWDWVITPEVLRRINWTMVSAALLYWATWNEVRPSLSQCRDTTSISGP